MVASIFRTWLSRPDATGAWTFAAVPKTVSERDGLRPRARVRGTSDGVPFTSTLIPQGGGAVFLVVNAEFRSRIGKEAGQSVLAKVESDLRPRVFQLPKELKGALARNPRAPKTFRALAPSHQKAYVQWVGGAKGAETRSRRAAQAIELLGRGLTLRDTRRRAPTRRAEVKPS